MGDKRQEIANELILIISGKKQKVKRKLDKRQERTVKPGLAFLKQQAKNIIGCF